ncbi:DUF542 domain-containing protein [Lentisphaerota bacterium WC36G]|nr:DUF542 domain-containing protein [Lentisphaerae bacterium WC36]
MNIDKNTAVGQIAALDENIRKYFEKINIDYCCNGHLNISEVLESMSLSFTEVTNEINKILNSQNKKNGIKFNAEKLGNIELSDYIVNRHHKFLRDNFPLIQEKLNKVSVAHHENHGGQLNTLKKYFLKLRNELLKHLDKEEELLFPVIKKHSENKDYPAEIFPLIEELKTEHSTTGDEFLIIKNITDNYHVPNDACLTFKSLYQDLMSLEQDIHEHIHLENNILFERISNTKK